MYTTAKTSLLLHVHAFDNINSTFFYVQFRQVAMFYITVVP